MKRKLSIVLLCGCLVSTAFAQESNLYKVIYSADRDGNRLSGSLEQLIDYIDNGNPVRVGWELMQKWPNDSVTYMRHWTDGGFVTTTRGQVFAQIRGIFGQGFAHISMEPGIFLSTSTPNSWVAVIGTDGTMRSKFEVGDWMKDMPEEQIKKMESSKAKTFWAVMVKDQ